MKIFFPGMSCNKNETYFYNDVCYIYDGKNDEKCETIDENFRKIGEGYEDAFFYLAGEEDDDEKRFIMNKASELLNAYRYNFEKLKKENEELMYYKNNFEKIKKENKDMLNILDQLDEESYWNYVLSRS